MYFYVFLEFVTWNGSWVLVALDGFQGPSWDFLLIMLYYDIWYGLLLETDDFWGVSSFYLEVAHDIASVKDVTDMWDLWDDIYLSYAYSVLCLKEYFVFLYTLHQKTQNFVFRLPRSCCVVLLVSAPDLFINGFVNRLIISRKTLDRPTTSQKFHECYTSWCRMPFWLEKSPSIWRLQSLKTKFPRQIWNY